MISVTSSNIAAIGYQNQTLYIRFHTSGTYAFYNVPEHLYQGLMNAGSHGEFFAKFIKGRYGDTKIS